MLGVSYFGHSFTFQRMSSEHLSVASALQAIACETGTGHFCLSRIFRFTSLSALWPPFCPALAPSIFLVCLKSQHTLVRSLAPFTSLNTTHLCSYSPELPGGDVCASGFLFPTHSVFLSNIVTLMNYTQFFPHFLFSHGV